MFRAHYLLPGSNQLAKSKDLNQFELLNEYLPKVDPPTQCEFDFFVTNKVQTPIVITILSCILIYRYVSVLLFQQVFRFKYRNLHLIGEQMVKKLSYIVLGVILLTSLVVVSNQIKPVNAALAQPVSTSVDLDPAEKPVAEVVAELPALEPTSTPDLSASGFFQTLRMKTQAAARSNWVYFKEYSKGEVDVSDFGAFENGQVLPTESISEQWMFVNEAGVVEQSISVQRTMEGEVVQVGVFSKGTGWNTATDEIIPQPPEALSFELDYGLRFEFLRSPDLQLSHSIGPDGKRLAQFVITKKEDQPVLVREYKKPQQAMEVRYLFDEDTGFITSLEAIAHFEDGTERVYQSIQVEVKLGVTPSAEVYEYLQMKQDREGEK